MGKGAWPYKKRAWRSAILKGPRGNTIHFLHVAYFLKLTDYADAQADLRLSCLHAAKSSFSQQGAYGMG